MVLQDHYAEGQDMKQEEVARPIGGTPSCCPLVKKKKLDLLSKYRWKSSDSLSPLL